MSSMLSPTGEFTVHIKGAPSGKGWTNRLIKKFSKAEHPERVTMVAVGELGSHLCALVPPVKHDHAAINGWFQAPLAISG